MTSQDINLDINQAFDNLLLAEEKAQQSGYVEGIYAAKSRRVNGYHLGYHRASVLAAQLGYYAGTLERYLSDEKNTTDRTISTARDALKSIYSFPDYNTETEDIGESVERVRSKYAKFCALAKINSVYPEADDRLDF